MVAIKDTEMPKNCKYCTRKPICGAYLNQYIKDPSSIYSYGMGERPDDCPLIEIITCKECDHYENMLVAIDKDGNKKILHVCKLYEKGVSEDFYCADAERKE